MNSIPNDLFFEIFSRLPSKSIGRCRCVSKLWCSMLQRPYFTELFLMRSSARPRLLFAIQRRNPSSEWNFFSLPQPQNPNENSSSLVVDAAEFHMTFPSSFGFELSCGYAFGLIFSKKEKDIVICNPNTGQYSILPKLRKHRFSRPFLGFDPIDKQFKVLTFISLNDPLSSYDGDRCRILTLGTGEVIWRKIQCPLAHFSFSEEICINGTVYFLARKLNEMSYGKKIYCFEVRSERFKFLEVETFYAWCTSVINYKGKLGVISLEFAYLPGTGRRTVPRALELRMWVLDDVEKPEWSKHAYTLHDDKIVDKPDVSVVGVTSTGEIVLSRSFNASKPFYVFYFSPEIKTLQSVEIQGLDEYYGSVNLFTDHVENLNLNYGKAT